MFSSDWLSVLNEVKAFEQACKPFSVWYRGHSNEDYKLNSGLFRKEYSDIRVFLHNEMAHYTHFKEKALFLHKMIDWGLLFLMQHHGARTRLLDWTETFSVALFFAFANWNPEKNAAIWLLHPVKLNYELLGLPDFVDINFTYEQGLQNPEFFQTSSIRPGTAHSRIHFQNGFFTLQGNNMLSLEEEKNGELIEKGILKKIILTQAVYSDVKQFLDLSNINYWTLFQDLDNLAKHINTIEDRSAFSVEDESAFEPGYGRIKS